MLKKFLKDELLADLKTIKNRKAVGLKDMLPEVWKSKKQIIEGVHAKNLKATLLFVDSVHRGMMEQILQAYGLPKETVNAVIMLFKNRGEKWFAYLMVMLILIVFLEFYKDIYIYIYIYIIFFYISLSLP